MTDQAEIHNELAGEIVRRIIKPVFDSGGEFPAVLVVLESVVLGVLLFGQKLGYAPNEVLETMRTAIVKRMEN